ncbi:NirD/YgiW/YdeI family stress tolerance protein [Pseudomaricurvus sp.]|uniref:NirD/YgiW/YdeI family stress tolerance protein n=1 Tax=Pseudomaricurvus sp. TaxID=2004510 RepID=UPI003F6CE506
MKHIVRLSQIIFLSSVVFLVACATTQTTAVTVADAQAAADGKEVVFDSKIAQRLEDDRYMVYDSTGEIVAIISEDILGKVQLSPSATIRVYGVVDRDDDASEVEVEKIQVMN